MIKTLRIEQHNWKLALLFATVALLPFSSAYAHENGRRSDAKVLAGTGMEISIGPSGTTLVRGAKVTSVSGSVINANTTLGSSVLSWTIKTGSDTQFSASKGAEAVVANIAIGDVISFSGVIDQAVSGLNVNATHVKDWTVASSTATTTKEKKDKDSRRGWWWNPRFFWSR